MAAESAGLYSSDAGFYSKSCRNSSKGFAACLGCFDRSMADDTSDTVAAVAEAVAATCSSCVYRTRCYAAVVVVVAGVGDMRTSSSPSS